MHIYSFNNITFNYLCIFKNVLLSIISSKATQLILLIAVKRLVCYFLLLTGLLCNITTGFAQSTSNQGTEFWTAWMMHSNGETGTGASSMTLYITGDVSTSGTVSLADGSFTKTFNIVPNSISKITIETSAYLNGQGSFLKGIHITSLKPVVVYAHIYASNRSGATLVLPVAALANDYYTINYTQKPATTNVPGGGNSSVQVHSTACVIATEDNTEVEITPAAALTDGTAKGQVKNIVLQKGQVYQLLGIPLSDLTGTRIRSISTGTGGCKKIAVYSGSSFIVIGATGSSGDNLFQQVYPVASWGKNFITAPLATRAYDNIRIVCSDPSAKVTVNNVLQSSTQLINNFYYDLPSISGPLVISADKPIQVAQYAVTQGNGNSVVGDPEMIYLSPIEQGLDHVTLYSPVEFNIPQSYVNVIIPTNAAASFKIDGNAPASAFTAISNSGYSYAQLRVASNATHVIKAADRFSAIAYGFGNFESYGYAAGTNLSNLNEFITLNSPNSTSSQLKGCTGVPYYLELTVPYQPLKIIWEPDNSVPPVTQNTPTYSKTEIKADGTQLYTYRLLSPVSYPVGNYTAKATVTLPVVTSNDCGAERIINFNFNITDFPVAGFIPPAGNCAGSPVQFTDGSNPLGSVITKWIWDFGDAANSTVDNLNTSTLQNPLHTFKTAGNYTVTLTVINENDCQSVLTSTKVIHVNANPKADFKFTTPNCDSKVVTFTDLSVSNEGTITEWKWDFGDGTAQNVLTSKVTFDHQFAVGTYNVTLTIATNLGCSSTITQIVTVHPAPLVSFVLPDACIKDVAKFVSTSTIADNTESDFQYEWIFDDPSSGTNNKAYVKNSQHAYTQPGNYNVTLKVTSKYGCIEEKTLPFFLNGAFPVAKFDMPTQVCSTGDLVIEDQTTVSPGKITKYEVYYDFDNNPSQKEVYDRDNLPIPANKLFRHNYGIFSTPLFKTYHVKIIVYSGSSADCSATFDKTITVNANPVVTLSYATDMCQESAAVQVAEDKHNFTGTGEFTGAGISATGLFNPKTAGPGEHTLHYKFIIDNTQCTYEQDFKIMVNPTPIITGKRDVTINGGETVTLNSLVVSLNSSVLTYKWTPKSGLDRDDVASPVASPSTDTQYLLTVTSANGCEAKAIFNVNVLAAPITYNTFTPNGDGYNDTWKIQNMQYFPKATVEVFNRNGQRVYYSIGYPVAWDGRNNGADLPAGVYYYIINVKNGKPVLSGSVTIIR